jgi:tRNA(fMet)-specific endonuclease VapC
VILLDTDHLTLLTYAGSPQAAALATRVKESPVQPAGTTIITVVEQFRGWSAEINRVKDLAHEVRVYDRLSRFVGLIRKLSVLPFDDRGAEVFESLRQHKRHIGSMDLKIASIALANDALLLSANLRDFRKVRGLRVEDWLRP